MYKEGFLLNKIMTFEMLSFLPLVDAMSYYYFSDRGPNNNWFICLDVFINSLQSLKNNTLLYLSGKEHMCHASCWGERTTCRSPFHFYLLGPRDGTQIIRLASKHFICCSTSSALQMFGLDELWKHFIFWKLCRLWSSQSLFHSRVLTIISVLTYQHILLFLSISFP